MPSVLDQAHYIYVFVFWFSIIKHNCKKDDDLYFLLKQHSKKTLLETQWKRKKLTFLINYLKECMANKSRFSSSYAQTNLLFFAIVLR